MLTVYHALIAEQHACGQAFRWQDTNSGVIISPNYPNAYPHNLHCVWTVIVPDNEVVTLTFTHMDLESDDNCRYDYVEVQSLCVCM